MFVEDMKLLGIRRSDDLVIYDRPGCFTSPGMYFVFKYFGHQGKVKVLNGGLNKWWLENRPIESGPQPLYEHEGGDYDYSVTKPKLFGITLKEMQDLSRNIVEGKTHD